MAAPERRRPASIRTEPPRGMRDILPDEAELRDAAAAAILAVYRKHGFRRVETPALEHIDLLTGSQGGENEKLIFKVLKRGERLALTGATTEAELVDLGLRFDLTVPLARYYAHNHAKLPQPLRAVQIGPVWRAERPQRGRYRQFTQCDIDILGVRSPIAEVELILATTEALAALGLADLTVRINDRRILGAMARACGFEAARHESVFITLDKWDKLTPAAVGAELAQAGHPEPAITRMLGLFTGFGPGCGLRWLREQLAGEDDAGGFDALARIIRAVEGEATGRFAIAFDPTLVRGMAYYTGPIFEIQAAAFPASIAGGGRYDDMIGRMLGRDVPATGFSIGFERVVTILAGRPLGRDPNEERIALIVPESTEDLGPLLREARALRDKGHLVTLALQGRHVGSQAAQLFAQGFDRVGLAEAGAAAPVRWLMDRRRGDDAGEPG
jgi:histidyl-tRNA synthetase